MIRRLKRLIRPLVPARLLARLRKPPSPPTGDINIDVVVATDQERWIGAAPDTVRVVDPDGYGPAPEATIQYPGNVVADGHDIVAVAARALDGADRADLLRPLADPGVAVSVLGAAQPGGLAGSLTPRIETYAMAVRRPVWDEVDGIPDVTLA